MRKLLLLCVEDEPEVRDAITRDIESFESIVRIEAAEDVNDARDVLDECLGEGFTLALVLCDHLLPGTKGVDFLVELQKDEETATAKKILITGQAGLEDTIKAVNDAGLDHYISKPWEKDKLCAIVKDHLTEFVIEEVDDLLPYVSKLDGARLLQAIKNRKETE